MIRSINKIRELFLDNKPNEVITEVEKFFKKFPYYNDLDYFSFSNAIEKAIYEKYFGSLGNSIVLQEEFKLNEVFLFYGISLVKTGNLEDGEKYLKIANHVNPVSGDILFSLLDFYYSQEDFSEIVEISHKIFKYTYSSYILYETYHILANYYLAKGEFELYENLIEFYLFFRFDKEPDSLNDIMLVLEMNDIPVGFNPDLIDITRELSESSLEELKESSKDSETVLDLDFNLDEIVSRENSDVLDGKSNDDGIVEFCESGENDFDLDENIDDLSLNNGNFDENENNQSSDNDNELLDLETDEDLILNSTKEKFYLEKFKFKFYNIIFREIIGLNSYLEGLVNAYDVEDVTRQARLLMAREDFDGAISLIKEFLDKYSLDNLNNYFFFNNEIERTLYYHSSDFDRDFVLLPKNKCYSYLYYLYGFSHLVKENYEEAKKYYLEALKINPFSFNINLALINVDLNQFKEIDMDSLRKVQKLAYSKYHYSLLMNAFSKNLLIMHRRDDSEYIEDFSGELDFPTDLFRSLNKNLNLKIIDLFDEFNLEIRFDESILNHTKEVLNYSNSVNDKNLTFYIKFYKEMTEYNDFISDYIGDEIELKENINFLRDFNDDELKDSFILVKDKFDEEYYDRIPFLKTDFDEEKFDSGNSFLVYGYKQVNGSLRFIFLTTSIIHDEDPEVNDDVQGDIEVDGIVQEDIELNTSDKGNIEINSRMYFYNDLLLDKDLLKDKEVIIIDELKQFKPYLKTSDNYSKWLTFNLSGDKDTDRDFLLNELENLEEDIFDSKRKSISYKLNRLIDYKKLLEEEIPCSKAIKESKAFIEREDYPMALAILNEFLKEYPFLYLEAFEREFHYFNNDFEEEMFYKYTAMSKNVIKLPPNQKYSEIFKLKALCLLNLKEYDESVRFADYCLNLTPMETDAKIILSDAYLNKKFYYNSVKILKEALLFNSDLNRQIEIYKKLAEAYALTSNTKVSDCLIRLSQLLSDLVVEGEDKLEYAFLYSSDFKDRVLDFRDLLIDEGILIGFNPDFIEVNKDISKINENIFFGTDIEVLIQETKPFLNDYGFVVRPKIENFIRKLSDSADFGYHIPKSFAPFGINLDGSGYTPVDMEGNEKYFNFRNDFELKLFNELTGEKINPSFLIPFNQKIVDLYLLYSDSLKYSSKDGIRRTIWKEVLKLNPLNCEAYLNLGDASLRCNGAEECKQNLDKCFELIYDKETLIEAYRKLGRFFSEVNMKDIRNHLWDFAEKLKENSFEEGDLEKYNVIFKQYDIQFGFNANLMAVINALDEDIYEKMFDLNHFLDGDKWTW